MEERLRDSGNGNCLCSLIEDYRELSVAWGVRVPDCHA